jgi:hypothetical protein
MYSERELKRNALRVAVPPNAAGHGGGTVAVISDAWFQLDVVTVGGGYSLLLSSLTAVLRIRRSGARK